MSLYLMTSLVMGVLCFCILFYYYTIPEWKNYKTAKEKRATLHFGNPELFYVLMEEARAKEKMFYPLASLLCIVWPLVIIVGTVVYFVYFRGQ